MVQRGFETATALPVPMALKKAEDVQLLTRRIQGNWLRFHLRRILIFGLSVR